jgi:FkbM family methyltransferase
MNLGGRAAGRLQSLMWRLAIRLVPWLPIAALRQLGSKLARPRPLGTFPGWHFAIEEQSPTPLIRLRRRLWDHFKRRGVSRPVRVRWFDGLRLDLVLGNDQSHCLFVGGSFEPNEFAFLASFLKPGMVVVDAGANEGFYSLFMARRVAPDGRVIAVEPSPRERQRLEHNLAINDIRNVHVVNAGLADRVGHGMLHIAEAEHNGQNTLGGFVYEGVRSLGALPIQLQPLDDVLARLGAGRVDLIKMDVEGAELDVLRGATRTLAAGPVVLFELFDEALRAQGSSAQQVLDFLVGKGFTILQFNEQGLPAPLRSFREASSNLIAVPSGSNLTARGTAAGGATVR